MRLLPHRALRGPALAPLAGAAAAAVSWTAVTWSGVGADSPVPWIVAVLAPAVTTLVLIPALSRARVRSDDAVRSRYGI